jgi:hypothetical protein
MAEGSLEPIVPERGPCEEPGPCRVSVHHRRRRKTGISWGWVAVARCANHALAFTLYPPGHVPYGRAAWVGLGPDGSELERGRGAERVAPSESFFAAVGDAARGERWERDSPAGLDDCVRSTQYRRVDRAAVLVGLGRGRLPDAEVVAAVTGLAAGDLVETGGVLLATRDLVGWAGAIGEVLARLARHCGRARMDRCAVLGHLAGWWGVPWRWLPQVGRLLDLAGPFRRGAVAGTRARRSDLAPAAALNDFGARAPP